MVKQMKLTTTLHLLKANDACTDGFKKLMKHLGADYPQKKPINLLTVLESNGVEDCLWCFRATIQKREKGKRIVAAKIALRVLHIFEEKYPEDDRPRKAIKAVLQNKPADERRDTKDEAWDAHIEVRCEYVAAYMASNAAIFTNPYDAGQSAERAALMYGINGEVQAQAEIIKESLTW